MTKPINHANNLGLAPAAQSAPTVGKVLGNPNLTNLIFSFLPVRDRAVGLPVSDWAVGQRICKTMRPDFEICQRLSGNVDTTVFEKYLQATKEDQQPAREIVDEIRKIAPFVKQLNCYLFQFGDKMRLLSAPFDEPFFPALRALSFSFYRYKDARDSSYQVPTTVEIRGKGWRHYQARCAEEVVLKTLASLGSCCPQLTSLYLDRSDEDDKPCEALLKGLVDAQGQHRIRNLRLTYTGFNKRDPQPLLDLCPRLESLHQKESTEHYPSSLKGPLTEIEIGNEIRPNELEAFANHPTLTKVKIGGERVPQASLVHLSKITHLQHLTFERLAYDMYSPRLTDLSCLSSAKELATLELVVHGDSKDVTILKTIPPHIQRLILNGMSKISDDVLEGFGRFTHLRHLDLRFFELSTPVQVTDKGLARLAKCQELRSLSLGARYDNEIQFTTEGILNLACQHLPHLQELDLRRFRNDQVDVEKIDAVLRQRRPKLNVYITEKQPKKN